MRYEFYLDDYYEIMDTINERPDVKELSFDDVLIAEQEDGMLSVSGPRIVIPELNLSFREGTDTYKWDDGYEEPSGVIVLYPENEKDPKKFSSCYVDSLATSIIAMIAQQDGLSTNPKCYIDDEEFILWHDK